MLCSSVLHVSVGLSVVYYSNYYPLKLGLQIMWKDSTLQTLDIYNKFGDRNAELNWPDWGPVWDLYDEPLSTVTA
jgi:hypothetical protein